MAATTHKEAAMFRPVIKLTRRPGSKRFVMRFLNPETGRWEQRSTGTSNKKEAQRIAGELRNELAQGRHRRDSGICWAEFRERFESEHLSGLKDMTVKKYDTVLDLVEVILKPSKLRELTADHISQFVAKVRNDDRAESTVASYVAHLRAALNWAANVGMLATAPRIRKPKRAKSYQKAKGRAPTEDEFRRILKATKKVVGAERADSWRHLIEGLWWSGLRLGEALELTWDDDEKLRVDLSADRPMFHIPAELEKGHKDRLLPIAPEFADFLLKTPAAKRTGFVFRPEAERNPETRLTIGPVTKFIAMIGREAGVVVHVHPKSRKVKYASAHDFRRAFGDRWAIRVMPAILMEMMRHESITTTMKFYIGRSAAATADVIWQAFANATANGKRKGDSLGDSQAKSTKPPSEKNDES
jgi:integrase